MIEFILFTLIASVFTIITVIILVNTARRIGRGGKEKPHMVLLASLTLTASIVTLVLGIVALIAPQVLS